MNFGRYIKIYNSTILKNTVIKRERLMQIVCAFLSRISSSSNRIQITGYTTSHTLAPINNAIEFCAAST